MLYLWQEAECVLDLQGLLESVCEYTCLEIICVWYAILQSGRYGHKYPVSCLASLSEGYIISAGFGNIVKVCDAVVLESAWQLKRDHLHGMWRCFDLSIAFVRACPVRYGAKTALLWEL